MQTAAALTMVRDDAFFLKAWLRHYGGQLGRENCYVINHGRGPEVEELAEGCNIIGLPGDPHKNFDNKRWRLLNGLLGGLRNYYNHVIVGDVDELVVVDPQAGMSLAQWLQDAPSKRIYTPVGLEVIHRIDLEHEPVGETILGPRAHVRPAPHYSKPCVASAPAKLSRGGHYSEYGKLHAPDFLYLFHLKFCDFAAYVQAMDRRNAVTAAMETGVENAGVGGHWFAGSRGEDRAVFEAFQHLEMQEGFDMKPIRQQMRRTFRARGKDGLYHFDRPNDVTQYKLPERFFGVI